VGEHHPCLFKGAEWFFLTGYRAHLPTEWIPALDGVEEKLRNGARVADVGCGHGASAVVMADAYPASRIWGFDFHSPSVDTARQRAEEAGVADRTKFEVADAKGYDGTFEAGEARLRSVFEEAGFSRFRRAAETPVNLIVEVRP
jgi:ribosomal protein L11 methylase PrmA